MRVYNKCIKGKSRVILSIVPKGQEDASLTNTTITSSISPFTTKHLIMVMPVWNTQKQKDNFDRNKVPASGPNPVVKVLISGPVRLTNKMKVIELRGMEAQLPSAFHFEGGPFYWKWPTRPDGWTCLPAWWTKTLKTSQRAICHWAGEDQWKFSWYQQYRRAMKHLLYRL